MSLPEINVPLYIEALANGDLTQAQRAELDAYLVALIAELRACRKVVEAASEIAKPGNWALESLRYSLGAALAELSSINVRSEESTDGR